jgi:hypothetical protein
MERIMTDATNDTTQQPEAAPQVQKTMTPTPTQASMIKRQIIGRATEIYTGFIQFISSLPRSPLAQDDVTEALEYLDLGFITLQRSVMKLPCEAIQIPVMQVPQSQAAAQPDVEATTEPTSEAPAPQVETPLDAA